MKKNEADAAADKAAAPIPSAEPANVAVFVLQNRTQIGKAICAHGKCDFPLTATEAQTLESLGKVRILGTF